MAAEPGIAKPGVAEPGVPGTNAPPQTNVPALVAAVAAHMSDVVRPTPSAQWLGAQPYVAALAAMLPRTLVCDTDGRAVTPVDHLGSALPWDALQRGYYVDLAALPGGCATPVRHLGVYTAAVVVTLPVAEAANLQ
jgi:hypothetical protein